LFYATMDGACRDPTERRTVFGGKTQTEFLDPDLPTRSDTLGAPELTSTSELQRTRIGGPGAAKPAHSGILPAAMGKRRWPDPRRDSGATKQPCRARHERRSSLAALPLGRAPAFL